MADNSQQLYTPEGKPVAVTDSQSATAAALAGKLLPKRGTKVGVVDPATGQVGEVDSDKLQTVLAQGATLASEDAYKAAQLNAKWGEDTTAGKFKNTAAALALGAGRGLSMGLSDAAIVEGAKALLPPSQAHRVKEYVRDVKEMHNIASGVGEAGGLIAGTIATGGEAGAAKIAAGAEGGALRLASRLSPAGLADALGGAVESRVAAGVEQGLGRGLGARILARTASGGARGLAESVPWSLGRSISEAELGDEKLTAEKVLANWGHDAVLFGGLGAGVGAGTGLFEAAASKMAPKLASAADTQALRMLDPTASAVKRVTKGGRDLGAAEELGGWVRRNLNPQPGETVESVVERLPAVGERIGQGFDELGQKLGSSAIVDATALANNLRKEVVAPMAKVPGLEAPTASAERYIDSLLEKSGGGKLSFQQAREWRMGLDGILDPAWRAVNPSTAQQTMMKVRNIFESHIEQGVEAASKDLEKLASGGNAEAKSLLDEYKGLKYDWGRFKEARDMAVNAAIKREFVHRTVSLTDYISGMGGLAGGLALGNPAIAVGGAALGAANHLARTRGNSTLAWSLGKLADFGALKSFVDGTDLVLANGAKGFVAGKPNLLKLRTFNLPDSAGTEKGQSLGARYAKVIAVLNNFSSNPEAMQQQIAAHTNGMAEVAPNTQQAMAATVANGLAYLNTKAPTTLPTNILQPGLAKPHLSDSDKATFLQYVEGTWNPLSVLQDLNAGHVSPEKVEALKAVHPKLFEDLQVKILAEVSDMTAQGKELPYQQRLLLGQVFQIPTDPSLEPQNLKALQATYAGAGPNGNAPKGPGRPPGSNTAANKLTSMFGTRLDRLANSPH